MTDTADRIPLGSQLTRRKPILEQKGPHAGPELRRSFGTFQLTMFGVGATVGTGIFFVLQEAVPDAGPAVIIVVPDRRARCRAVRALLRRDGQRDPGERLDVLLRLPRARRAGGDGGRRLRAAGVRRRRLGRGRRLERLLQRAARQPVRRGSCPTRCRTRRSRTRTTHRAHQPAGRRAGAAVHAAADPRRQRVGQGQRDHGGDQARRAADVRRHRVHRVQRRPLRRTSGRRASPASAPRPATIFFSFIGLDAVSTAGEEVRDPQKAMPRAIMGALRDRRRPSTCWSRSPASAPSRSRSSSDPEQQSAGLVGDPREHHRQHRVPARSSPPARSSRSSR